MGRIILEEQAAADTPAANKISIYPKAGGGVYKKNDAGAEKQFVEAGADSLITSMTGLDDDGIPLAKIANAASDGANSDITSLGALSGAQTIPTINLTGGQIAFPATAVPSADPNTMDDYEEGTWTPDLQFGGAKVGITYLAAATGGSYTKIGDRVIISGIMSLTSKGSSNGNATIAGLPFVCENLKGAYTPLSIAINVISFADFPQFTVHKNSSAVYLYEVSNAGARTTLTDANFSATSEVQLNGSYPT